MPARFYLYRCTTQQLETALNEIADAGDQVVSPTHVGGRDWVIVCTRLTGRDAP